MYSVVLKILNTLRMYLDLDLELKLSIEGDDWYLNLLDIIRDFQVNWR